MSDRGRKSSAACMQSQHDHRQHSQSQVLEDLIMTEKGVQVRVKMFDHQVSIRANSYSEYLLAKSAIRGRVSSEIVWGNREPQSQNINQ